VLSRTLRALSLGSPSAGDFRDVTRLARQTRFQSEIQQRALQAQSFGIEISEKQNQQIELDTQREIISKMRELATQAASESLSSSQRLSLQKEFESLLESVDSEVTPPQLFQQLTGAGGFQSPTTLTTGSNLLQPAVGDFDQDGNLDIVQNDGQSFFTVRLGKGDGTFNRVITTAKSGGSLNLVKAGDVDNDGILDVVGWGAGIMEIAVYRGKGDGSFHSAVTFNYSSTLPRPEIGDYDGDGDNELFVVSSTWGIYEWTGSGFSSVATGSIGASTLLSANQDLNNDGRDDLVLRQVATNYLGVQLSNGDGTFGSLIDLGVSASLGVLIEDLNDDGNLDLVGFANFGTVATVFLGNGLGSFTSSDSLTGASMWLGVGTSLDYNGDGIKDILAPDDVGSLSLYLGQGGGVFGNRQTVSAGIAPDWMVAADFNSDGIRDLFNTDISSINANVSLLRTKYQTARSALSLLDLESAQTSQGILDRALDKIDGAGIDLALAQNQLEIRVSENLLFYETLTQAQENSAAQDSVLWITQMVTEQIRQQALVAVMTQANVQMRTALELLRF
jgi:flagellin-like hook-associated protein FlgL